MKTLLVCLVFILSSFTVPAWQHNLDKARQQAVAEHKYILLNFSGSDWCGPCIRMHKEIFDTDAFTVMAEKKLVLVNADFPRLKKNQLPKEQQQLNDKIADAYNRKGDFPLTVLLRSDGSVVKSWEGFPKMTTEAFIADIESAMGQ
jgi:thioredoxin-related protein